MSKKKTMKVDHKNKTVTITRQLNPPSFHGWMKGKITKEHPGYTIIEDFEDA